MWRHMNKSIALIFVLFTMLLSATFFSIAETSAEEPAPPPPLDPKYMGIHGMVLVANMSSMYASHLPMYHEPHNVQLIYTIENKNLSLMRLVLDADLVTIKPKPFNLQHLMRGEKFTVVADVYLGHFERGGMPTFKDLPLNFEKQLYLRSLDDPEKSHIRHKYDTVDLPNNKRLLVHRIQTAPSYDQLILLFDNVSCMTEFATATAVPSESEIYHKLAFCGSMKPLYYETYDFRQ